MTTVTSNAPYGRREANKLDKQERIRRAALDLFRKQGFDATTTKQVADRAGVATGTLFLYAADKTELLLLVMHDALAAIVDARLSSLPKNADLLDELLHVFGGFFAHYATVPDLARAFIKHFPGSTGTHGVRVHALTFALMHRLAQRIVARQTAGQLAHDIDAYQAAQNFFALYLGALMAWLSGYVTLEDAQRVVLRDSLALQIRGLLPR